MSELNNHLRVKINIAFAKLPFLLMLIVTKLRVSVLTEKMFRVEVSKDGEFCDLPTQKVWHRAFDIVQYDIADMGKYIEVKTASIAAKISKDGKLKSVLLQDGRNVTNPPIAQHIAWQKWCFACQFVQIYNRLTIVISIGKKGNVEGNG